MTVPFTRPGHWPTIAPGRFAATIVRDEEAISLPASAGPGMPPGIALLGLPDDTGVALNGGRLGAVSGPSAFRAALAAYGTPFDLARGGALDVRVVDAGDVMPIPGGTESSLLETHARVTDAVRALHDRGFLPVCVGGGHDLTLPSVRALSDVVGSGVGGVSVDAHLDVRAEVGSGMPFRWLIEEEAVDPRRFTVFGAARFVHRADHVAWLEQKGVAVVGVEEARAGTAPEAEAFARALNGPAAFVSIDLDALDGAVAPGVSAVNPDGLDVSAVARIAERAGREPAVRHFDLMELSPPHDEAGRTARVAAFVFLQFVAGFARRASP
jgi:formimidoylglutamase